jgi:hypothetical protein
VKTPGEAFEVTKRYATQAPVRVFDLARELGLGPIFGRLPDNISGLLRRRVDGEWEIVVNQGHALVRQRFTVAHEIGHFIFHRDRLASGVSDTLAYRADDVEMPNPQIGSEQERQANNFAANLLIPASFLREAQAAGMIDDQALAGHFQVSRGAMRIRLGLPMAAAA